ncbi:MAG: hypothetical protein ACJ763_15360 [Bdellovibrionia bacterium]
MRATFSQIFVLLFSLLALSPLHSYADEPVKLAIEVDIRGGFVGFDTPAFATVRAVMASLIMDGTLAHWITTSRGMEGGGTYCMQFHPEFISRKSRVLAQFQNIHVNEVSTAYSVRELERCEIPALK